MATTTDLLDNVFFVGADWPLIPIQLDPEADVSAWTLEFRVYNPQDPSSSTPIFTMSTGNGGIKYSGTYGTVADPIVLNAVTGFVGALVSSASSTLLVSITSQANVYRYEVWRTDSGFKNRVADGRIPVRG